MTSTGPDHDCARCGKYISPHARHYLTTTGGVLCWRCVTPTDWRGTLRWGVGTTRAAVNRALVKAGAR